MTTNSTTVGWKGQPDGRGTFDIFKTCFGTIFLLCWSSVCPNVPSLRRSRWSQFSPKLQLFLLALLGPDFVLMIATGQLTAAWKAKKQFHARGFTSWTLRQCFYVNMGGLHLQFPDRLSSFPVDCGQLLYLQEREYMSLPELSDEEVDDRNKSDGLSRFIAIVQSLWFTIDAFGRIAQGLHISTLELTTLAFVFLMTACSVCWWRKPMDISRPNIILVQETLLATIHRDARVPDVLHGRTPLSFLNREEWFLSQIWISYTCVLRVLKIVPKKRTQPTEADHFPPIEFRETYFRWELAAGLLIMAYSAIFMAGWFLEFPTTIERTLWRISAATSLAYGVLGCAIAWYCKNGSIIQKFLFGDLVNTQIQGSHETEKPRLGLVRNWVATISNQFECIRNMTPDKDPALTLPARTWFATSLLCAAYTIARLYILVEDIAGLRALPGSAYDTVNWAQYSPFL